MNSIGPAKSPLGLLRVRETCRWNSVGLLQDKSCTHSNDYAFSIRHGQLIGEFADVIKKKSTD
jgi:hypothetical protein